MAEKEHRSPSYAVWTGSALVLLLAMYVVAYIGASSTTTYGPPIEVVDGRVPILAPSNGSTLRSYSRGVPVRVFVPAAWVEAKVARYVVMVGIEDGNWGTAIQYSAKP